MGCAISTAKLQKSIQKKNLTFDGTYVAMSPPTKGLSKRLWSNNQHASLTSSSGVSSAGSCTPVRNTKTIRRRRITPHQVEVFELQKPAQPNFEPDLTYQNIPAFLKNVPLDIETQAEVFEQQHLERQQQIASLQAVLSETFGYYSNESSDCSTPLDNNFICTQNDISAEMENLNSNEAHDCDLDMEMELMGKAFGVMPKTSSPMLQRRNTANSTEDILMPPPSVSYQKWQKSLQTTPTYTLNNVSRIPEAIAGRFCPATFPAFTIVKTTKYHAVKRYPENSYYQACKKNSTETFIKAIPPAIPTTEL